MRRTWCSSSKTSARSRTTIGWVGASASSPSGSGEEVVLALFRAVPEIRRLVNADVLATYEGDPAARNVEEIFFSYPSIEAVVAYRVAHHLYLAGVP